MNSYLPAPCLLEQRQSMHGNSPVSYASGRIGCGKKAVDMEGQKPMSGCIASSSCKTFHPNLQKLLHFPRMLVLMVLLIPLTMVVSHSAYSHVLAGNRLQ
eukprot:5469822-Amphidinium_carterae.1